MDCYRKLIQITMSRALSRDWRHYKLTEFEMRWFWIDRFEKFVSGDFASSIKNVTMAEEAIDDYSPGHPHYSHSLIIEGMAQTGGILISQQFDFQARVVLAKVSKAEFYDVARPGDTLDLTAKQLSLQNDGAIIEGKVLVRDKLIAEIDLTFAILDESYGEASFFIPGELLALLRSMRLFDVGVHKDGSPISPPKYMLEDEREFLTRG